MNRFAQALGCALLLAATGLHGGCGGGASGLTTGSTTQDAPASITNEHPMARPVAVAWTSARARRCGFYFDPVKLRSSYLSYEAQQGAAREQLAKIESSYDSTFQLISDRIGADADYCTERKGAEIKADLTRHLAGDFSANLPKPKAVAQCGGLFNPCDSGRTDQPFDSKKFWEDKDKSPKR